MGQGIIDYWFGDVDDEAAGNPLEDEDDADPDPQQPLLPAPIVEFPGFLQLPIEVQDMIWAEAFPVYKAITGEVFEVIIRLGVPDYHPPVPIDPWYVYHRAFTPGHLSHYFRVTVSLNAIDRRSQFTVLASVDQRMRHECHRIFTILQIDNCEEWFPFSPSRDSIFLDPCSLFLLWLYDHQTPNAEFQMTGYDQIQALWNPCTNLDFAGMHDLRYSGRQFSGRRILRGLAEGEEQLNIGVPPNHPLHDANVPAAMFAGMDVERNTVDENEVVEAITETYEMLPLMLPEGTRYIHRVVRPVIQADLERWTRHILDYFFT
ncbi:uncharacterized protein PAC_07470 [Phialocephala subalpina]|uniref:Uncharacterized protein n=1 Tax=Phialocephala subalpina TaxID=576137 RepID=A0A1L7WXT0_9HELO|nr:uncharacterized protein PAC_07470 [Phialocephala subalpina]